MRVAEQHRMQLQDAKIDYIQFLLPAEEIMSVLPFRLFSRAALP